MPSRPSSARPGGFRARDLDSTCGRFLTGFQARAAASRQQTRAGRSRTGIVIARGPRSRASRIQRDRLRSLVPSRRQRGRRSMILGRDHRKNKCHPTCATRRPIRCVHPTTVRHWCRAFGIRPSMIFSTTTRGVVDCPRPFARLPAGSPVEQWHVDCIAIESSCTWMLNRDTMTLAPVRLREQTRGGKGERWRSSLRSPRSCTRPCSGPTRQRRRTSPGSPLVRCCGSYSSS